jgi:hypothetical protein
MYRVNALHEDTGAPKIHRAGNWWRRARAKVFVHVSVVTPQAAKAMARDFRRGVVFFSACSAQNTIGCIGFREESMAPSGAF